MNASEAALQRLRARIAQLERVVEVIAASLSAPRMCRYGLDRGYRYDLPDIRHFCLLKTVRVVSALNAAVELARAGYTQEIAVLMRTLVECTTHLEYVVNHTGSAEQLAQVDKYVNTFFADSRRDPEAEIKKVQVPQGTVHRALGGVLDRIAEHYGETEGRFPAEKLYSATYRIFSNFVHAKYPEIMDLYGGTPGRFHLRGMSGTPKDEENIATLETFILTASNAFVLMIQALNLRDLVETNPDLAAWYREGVGASPP